MRLHVTFNLYLPESLATLAEAEEWIRWQLGERKFLVGSPLSDRHIQHSDVRATDVEVEER